MKFQEQVLSIFLFLGNNRGDHNDHPYIFHLIVNVFVFVNVNVY